MISKVLIAVVTLNAGLALAGGSTSAGPAHPASQHCLSRGGQEVLVDVGAFGGDQMSVCRLSDDSVIETMTFWRQTQEPTIALPKFAAARWHTYDGLPMERWAERNCSEVGGSILVVVPHLRPSVKYQLCRFSDGSAIEAWTLMYGPAYYPALAR